MVSTLPLSADFRETPLWWEAFDPRGFPMADLPAETGVAIVGAGYTGLSAAIELGRHGVDCCVLDQGDPGYCASTRSGGIVSGPGGVKTPLVNPAPDTQRQAALVQAAADALTLLESRIDASGVDCQWRPHGQLRLATTRRQLDAMAEKMRVLQAIGLCRAERVTGERLGALTGSGYYRGGLVTRPGGHLHPGLYFAALLKLAKRSPTVGIAAHAGVTRIEREGGSWRITTSRGSLKASQLLVATNGYTGDFAPALRRRLLPIRAYLIATAVIDDDLARAISPANMAFVDSSRIAPFYRLSGEDGGWRLVFGSRVKWRDISATAMAPHLYRQMVARFPGLAGTPISHAWEGNVALTLDERYHNGERDGMHYALGCNGSGVANMSWLGAQAALRLLGDSDYASPFDGTFPDHPLYDGRRRWFVPWIGRYLMARDWLDHRVLDRGWRR